MTFILHLFQQYGYWGLCGALAAEYLFFPVPAETSLTATGVLWQQSASHLNLYLLILSATFGTFMGSLIAYTLGRTIGRPFILKIGKYVRLTPERLQKQEKMFMRYTIPMLFISRYIAFVRIIVPYLAGINRIRLRVFVPVVLIGSLAWTTTFILAGSLIEHAIVDVIHHWRTDLIPGVIVLIALCVGYFYLHRFLKRKMDAAEARASEEQEHSNTL